MNYEPTYLGEIELSEDTLAHYGVKGMRWRHKKGVANQVTTTSGRRPVGRQRYVTGSGTGAYKKGTGLGTGQVGTSSSATHPSMSSSTKKKRYTISGILNSIRKRYKR